MKSLNKISMIAGVVLGVSAVSAQAAGYDPVSADRYSPMVVAFEQTTTAYHDAKVGNTEGHGFKPFAPHRYTQTMAKGSCDDKHAEGESKDMGNDEGAGFRPFASDRYAT